MVGAAVYPLADVLSARGVRHRTWLRLFNLHQYALMITTAAGESEVLRHRNGYLVFQLAKAVETALRELRPATRTRDSRDYPAAPGAGTLADSLAT
jgi:hypothetical protein